MHVGPVLSRSRSAFLLWMPGPRAGLREIVTELRVEYFVALVVAVLAFGYVLYALLRPEKF